MSTLAPSLASRWAQARPIPEDPAVTMALLHHGDTEDRVSTGGHDDRISRDLLRKRRRLFRKQRRAQNA